ncbi:hypothetical protein PDK03_07375 [Bacillus cereus group sp. TH204-1LC]|uniref:hypothetical protein n=1 Tax=Bacillus cereus group TaxID=86661 RepID=UPI001120E7BE|nr:MULTISPECIES: hypothetical protein [Bacillus cereus group]MDA1616418.1 hypothetical protein [Bacillus cereus group sp. TH204-1LC]TNP19080.1 hypothetical protein FHY73_15445 [Bacillus tropicus]
MEQIKVVDCIDKGDLESLLNVILEESSNALEVIQNNDAPIVTIKYIQEIVSQALLAWDMQEFVEADGEDRLDFLKEAYGKVNRFERIEWRG